MLCLVRTICKIRQVETLDETEMQTILAVTDKHMIVIQEAQVGGIFFYQRTKLVDMCPARGSNGSKRPIIPYWRCGHSRCRSKKFLDNK